jgi:hypothetical protein
MRPEVVSHYQAEIRFNSRIEDAAFTAEPLAIGTLWYRGDLHMHTGHSDGNCKSQGGQRVPCPLFLCSGRVLHTLLPRPVPASPS